MKFGEAARIIESVFPNADWGTDNDGQIVIYAGAMIDFSTGGDRSFVSDRDVVPWEEPEGIDIMEILAEKDDEHDCTPHCITDDECDYEGNYVYSGIPFDKPMLAIGGMPFDSPPRNKNCNDECGHTKLWSYSSGEYICPWGDNCNPSRERWGSMLP